VPPGSAPITATKKEEVVPSFSEKYSLITSRGRSDRVVIYSVSATLHLPEGLAIDAQNSSSILFFLPLICGHGHD
jgi:hypothetical protein